MSRIGDALRALAGQRDASLGSMLGPNSRVRRSAGVSINQESALKISVWWAGLVLRANVESSFPIDVVRKSGDLMVSVKNPGPLVTEPWPDVDISEFIFSTRFDKDRYGNAVGIIRERNAYGLPSAVELCAMSTCRAQMDGGKIIQWRIDGKYYDKRDIWHERQYTMPGFELGLSPLAYAAETMGVYASTLEFAAEWFGNGLLPKGTLKHNGRGKIGALERRAVKEQFKEDTQNGDIFVTGTEWEWTPSTTTAATAGFLDQRADSARDICRYVGVPAGMIDVEISTGNVTYGSVSAFDLQWLVTQMGPAVQRTERYWSRRALPKPWKFKMNTDALLRMDPAAKAELMVKLGAAKLRTPTELRALDNLPPYTADDLAEIALFAQMGKPAPGPAPTNLNQEVTPWLLPS